MGQDQDVWVCSCSLVVTFALILLLSLYLQQFFLRKSLVSCLSCFPDNLLPQLPLLQPGFVRIIEIICCAHVGCVQTLPVYCPGILHPGPLIHPEDRRRMENRPAAISEWGLETGWCGRQRAALILTDQEHKTRLPRPGRRIPERNSSSAGELLQTPPLCRLQVSSRVCGPASARTQLLPVLRGRRIRYTLTFYDKESKQVQFYRLKPDHIFSMDTGYFLKNAFFTRYGSLRPYKHETGGILLFISALE